MENQDFSEEIHLRDYLQVIKKRSRLIITFLVVTFILVVIATFAATPQYEGSCKIMIEKVEPSDFAGGRYYMQRDPEFLETQFQLIKSKRVAKRVVENLGLVQSWDSYMGTTDPDGGLKGWISRLKQSVKGVFGSTKTDDGNGIQKDPADEIAESLIKELKVSPVKNSRVVRLSYHSPDAQLSALIVNAFAKAYIEESLNMNMESTRRTLTWMTKKADEERKKLEGIENRLQQYMDRNNIVMLENRVAILPQKLAELSRLLVQAETEREQLESLYRLTQSAGKSVSAAESISAITDDDAMKAIRSQIVAAEQNIYLLSQKYGPKHPVMKKAVRDLELLKSKRNQEITRGMSSIKNKFDLAKANEKNLRNQVEKTKAEALSLNEKFIQYGVYKHELETNRQLYDALMLKIKEKSITEETQHVNMMIVEGALPQENPVKPRKKVNLLLGLIVGLFGGIGLAFFVEYLDNTVKHPDETERIVRRPVMGLIPFYDAKEGSIDDVVKAQPFSPWSEGYKAMRTSLLLSAAGSPPKSLLITSSLPGEGKTTTALNLAYVMAQTDKKVLLIDADLRKPRIHKVLKLSNQDGLTSFLAGVSSKCNVQNGVTKNLSILTAGPMSPNPSELLSSERMAALIASASEKYDVVILDTAPVLSVTDAQILTRNVDGTLLVAKAHKATYTLVNQSIRFIDKVQGRLIGISINGFQEKKHGYYQYQYGYGEKTMESPSNG